MGNNSSIGHQGEGLVPIFSARSEGVATVALEAGSLGIPRDLDDVTKPLEPGQRSRSILYPLQVGQGQGQICK